MNATPWPPDWRAQQADAYEAATLALGTTLGSIDEAEALLVAFGIAPSRLSELRAASAVLREARNDLREKGDALRAALADAA